MVRIVRCRFRFRCRKRLFIHADAECVGSSLEGLADCKVKG